MRMFSKKKGKEKENENLNFIWVGKPRSQLGGPLGTDLAHVAQMAKKADNPISFYCLEEHKTEYENIVKKNKIKNVSVISIDEHIETMAKTQNFGEQGIQMQSMRNELLKPPRDRIIDKVTFKDAFSLFILATKGGYTLDTNIQLDSTGKKKFTFPERTEFSHPWGGSGLPEVWMMYAPQQSQHAQKALNHYLKNWGDVQDIIRDNLKNPPAIYDYHSEITGLMTDSVDNRKFHTDWKFAMFNQGYKATIPALPIAKNYGNSHKPYIEVQEIIRQDLVDFINERNDGPSSTTKTLQGLIIKIDTMIANIESPDAIENAQLTVNRILKFTEILDQMEHNFSKHKNLDKSISSDFTDNLKTARKEMKDYAKQLLDTPIPQMPDFEDGHKKKFDKLINGLNDLETKANKSQAEQKISTFKDFKSELKQSVTKPPNEKNIQNDASDALSSRISI